MTTFASFAVDVASIIKQPNVFDYGCALDCGGYSAPMFYSGLNMVDSGMNMVDPSLNLYNQGLNMTDPSLNLFGSQSFGNLTFAPTGFSSNYDPSAMPFLPLFSPASFDFQPKNDFFMDRRSLNKNTDTAPAPSIDIKGLQPQMQTALQELHKRALAEGIDFKIESGYRTNAQQQKLYETSREGGAAKPGYSQHEKGMAVDLSIANKSGVDSKRAKQRLGQIWGQMGYTWGGDWAKNKEDWHFDMRSSSNLAKKAKPNGNLATSQYNPFM